MLDAPDDNLFLRYRTDIESVIRCVCHRCGLRRGEAEDFAAEVRLRLVENDYAKLRKFQGRSSPQTYLTVVITREALDYRTAQWGRWRPRTPTVKAGPAAVVLERLVVRDGMVVDEALTIVEREFGPVDRAALKALGESFSPRIRRLHVGEEALVDVAADGVDPERQLRSKERAALFERVWAQLMKTIEALPEPDRLAMTLHFEQGMKVADVARLQGLEQKQLYRRIDNVKAELKRRLEREGIDAETVRDTLDDL